MSVVVKYTAFAIIATVLNLLTQEFVVQLASGPGALYLAIIAGTLTGLLCKYLLDKHYIFAIISRSTQEDMGRFLAYSVTGVVTTLIFWAFELGFELAFASKTARYLGACLGLAIGYGIKYRLDKRFVFSQ